MQALSQLSYAPVFALPLMTDIIIKDAMRFVKYFFHFPDGLCRY